MVGSATTVSPQDSGQARHHALRDIFPFSAANPHFEFVCFSPQDVSERSSAGEHEQGRMKLLPGDPITAAVSAAVMAQECRPLHSLYITM